MPGRGDSREQLLSLVSNLGELDILLSDAGIEGSKLDRGGPLEVVVERVLKYVLVRRRASKGLLDAIKGRYPDAVCPALFSELTRSPSSKHLTLVESSGARPPRKARASAAAKPVVPLSIVGDRNIANTGTMTVHIHVKDRPKRKPPASEGGLSSSHAKRIKDLVAQVVDIGVQQGETPKRAYSAAWSKVNNHFGVRSYTDIPDHRSDEVVAYLLKILATETKRTGFRARPTAKRTAPLESRVQLVAAIGDQSKRLGMVPADVMRFVAVLLGLKPISLNQLSIENLMQIYQALVDR